MQDILSMSYVKSALEEFEEKANFCRIFLIKNFEIAVTRSVSLYMHHSFLSYDQQALWPKKE